ncbi:MAG: hypothetical protein QM726_17030 [Chitinophagaceae bacterium]
MCNCGSKRNSFVSSANNSVNRQPVPAPTEKMWPDVNFVYTGHTALSATGKVTGKQYRFNAPGDKQSVDFRDAASMMNVPVLKRVG